MIFTGIEFKGNKSDECKILVSHNIAFSPFNTRGMCNWALFDMNKF